MAPKKKDDKKKADAGPDPGELAATAFAKKNYAASSAQFEVEPLPLVLDRGEEGTSAFLHLAIHPGLSPDPKHACSPKHVRALMHALGEYAFLKRMAFWSVAVKDEGCASIASFLVSNRSLTSLDLTDVGISVPGCKALGEALEKNATLQVLRLDHNASIGVRGAAILGDSLTRNLGLSTLSLTYCLLEGTEAAEALVAGAMRSPALRVLELKGNRFGVDGVLVLLRALRTCASLFRIDLADTGWGMQPEVHAALEECFEVNRVCHEYALSHNHVGDSTVYRWLNMVKRLEHLICIDVSNQCDPLLFKQIGDECAKNKKDWLKRQKKKGGKKGAPRTLQPRTLLLGGASRARSATPCRPVSSNSALPC
jgi:hypothetical protein